MPLTNKFDVFYPADIPNNFARDMQLTAESVETVLNLVRGIGLKVNRPTVGTLVGQEYYATDEDVEYFWIGTEWVRQDRFTQTVHSYIGEITSVGFPGVDTSMAITWTPFLGRRYEMTFTSDRPASGAGLIYIDIGGVPKAYSTSSPVVTPNHIREWVTNGVGVPMTAKVKISGTPAFGASWGYVASATNPAIFTIEDVT